MTSPALLPEFKTCPAVFAVKNDYQIMVPVKSDLLFWVTVDGKNYYDHSNGIIRSSTRMHRVNVPMCALDKTGEYTVTYRKIIDRKPYFAETEEPVSATLFVPSGSGFGRYQYLSSFRYAWEIRYSKPNGDLFWR